MTHAEKVKKIAKILKKRFNNLTAEELIHISFLIVEELDEVTTKVEIKPDERIP